MLKVLDVVRDKFFNKNVVNVLHLVVYNIKVSYKVCTTMLFTVEIFRIEVIIFSLRSAML